MLASNLSKNWELGIETKKKIEILMNKIKYLPLCWKY